MKNSKTTIPNSIDIARILLSEIERGLHDIEKHKDIIHPDTLRLIIYICINKLAGVFEMALKTCANLNAIDYKKATKRIQQRK